MAAATVETWMLAAQHDRNSCLMDDETGAEYFPYLLAMIDAKKGSIIGISSCREITAERLQQFFIETSNDPSAANGGGSGAARLEELWLLDLVGPLAQAAPKLGVLLQPDGVKVSRRGTTAEVKGMLQQLSDMLEKKARPPRQCHSCAKEIAAEADSRCSGCKALYYCSRKCQSVDWKKGGHKAGCALLAQDMVRNHFENAEQQR